MPDVGVRDGHSPLPLEPLELHPGDGLGNPCLCTNRWGGRLTEGGEPPVAHRTSLMHPRPDSS